jgi:hypothetical protein
VNLCSCQQLICLQQVSGIEHCYWQLPAPAGKLTRLSAPADACITLHKEGPASLSSPAANGNSLHTFIKLIHSRWGCVPICCFAPSAFADVSDAVQAVLEQLNVYTHGSCHHKFACGNLLAISTTRRLRLCDVGSSWDTPTRSSAWESWAWA